MNKLTTICIILSILSWMQLSAQINYNDFESRGALSCGFPDSTTLAKSQSLLDSLKPFDFIEGESRYTYDHGWVYYQRYMKWKNIADLQRATELWEENWAKHRNLTALYNLGGAYRPLGDCRKALDYTELYLQEVPDSIPVDYQQIYYRYKFCRGKE